MIALQAPSVQRLSSRLPALTPFCSPLPPHCHHRSFANLDAPLPQHRFPMLLARPTCVRTPKWPKLSPAATPLRLLSRRIRCAQ